MVFINSGKFIVFARIKYPRNKTVLTCLPRVIILVKDIFYLRRDYLQSSKMFFNVPSFKFHLEIMTYTLFLNAFCLKKILFDNSFINVHLFVFQFTLNLKFYMYSSKLHLKLQLLINILINFCIYEIYPPPSKKKGINYIENLL